MIPNIIYYCWLSDRPVCEWNQLKSHLMCHNELPQEDYSLRGVSLIRLYKNMLSTRYWNRRTTLRQQCRAIEKDVYKRTSKEFWTNPSIPISRKVMLQTFYHFPFTYAAVIRFVLWRHVLGDSRNNGRVG